MLPLWREQLLIALGPDELSWIKLGGALHKQVTDKRTVQIDGAESDHAWDGAIAALRSVAQEQARNRLVVRIVLSNHFVRYLLIPPSNEIASHEEELALARFHFARVHGDASQEWDIRMHHSRAGGTRLACAVDGGVINALQQTFPDAHLRLASVQPMLMAVVNQRQDIPDREAWVLMVEARRTCLLLIDEQMSIRVVQNVRGQFADADSWVSLVERERWRIDGDSVPTSILIHTSQRIPVPNQRHGSWTVKSLRGTWPAGLSPERDIAYSTALCAA